ncbi:MAG: T9SS type A sorting domain-containing protein, partial [Bacteroidetes bacterium]|nr:T9SS type A sorting domain-containing protein [Bacteroidota bacterium]
VSTSKSYSLSFKMCADDAVDTVKLNGVAKGVFLGPSFNNIPGVTKPYLLEISACDTSFRTGQNFIDISIADAGGSVGFYAEIILSEISNACLSQVGIEEHSMQGSFFSIHPNPAHASLNINLNTQFIKEITKTVSFKIFSIDGKLIKTEEINKTALSQYIINTSDLNNGLYYLTITSGNYSQNFKFIKE